MRREERRTDFDIHLVSGLDVSGVLVSSRVGAAGVPDILAPAAIPVALGVSRGEEGEEGHEDEAGREEERSQDGKREGEGEERGTDQRPKSTHESPRRVR